MLESAHEPRALARGVGVGARVLIAERAGQGAIDQDGELAGGGGEGFRLADADGQPAVEGAEGGLAADETHGGNAQHGGRAVGGGLGFAAEAPAAGDPVLGREGEPGGEVVRGGPAAEIALMRERAAFWTEEERGYSHIQGTKPQTLGYGLNDSPVGLAAWIVEKYRSWCDCEGDPETKFSKDELLTTITIYWVTQTATSAARYYYEGRHSTNPPSTERIGVPTACMAFPKELGFTPRRWLEARYNLRRFTIMPSGGHFAASEEPELFVGDVRAFFRELRSASTLTP